MCLGVRCTETYTWLLWKTTLQMSDDLMEGMTRGMEKKGHAVTYMYSQCLVTMIEE